MEPPASKPKLLAIVGETGSGKSALAMKIAKEFNGEIISADSWSVYKGFDIGTAKPSENDRKVIRHHLMDVAEPEDGFNAPKFKILAQRAIKDIRTRGKLPILVGGTGLYIDSLLFDYSFLPNGPRNAREKLEELSLGQLLSLAQEKSINLADVDLRNKRRVIRAIESGGRKPEKKDMMEEVLIIGIQTSRAEVRSKIEARVEQMFNRGLEQEVKQLADNLGWEAEPMKGIGYKEFKEYFEGSQSLETTKERIISNTTSLAKRQRTWFKRNPSIQWFPSPDTAYQEVCTVLNT